MKKKQYCQEPGLNAFRQHQLISSHRVCHTISILDRAGLEMQCLIPGDQKKQHLTKSTSSASQVTFQQSKPWLPGNISESIPHLLTPLIRWFLIFLLGRETPDFCWGWPWVGLHKSQHFGLCLPIHCCGYFPPMWSRWPTQPVFWTKNLVEY